MQRFRSQAPPPGNLEQPARITLRPLLSTVGWPRGLWHRTVIPAQGANTPCRGFKSLTYRWNPTPRPLPNQSLFFVIATDSLCQTLFRRKFMTSISTLKTDMMQTIAAIDALDSLRDSLRETIRKLNELPPTAISLLAEPSLTTAPAAPTANGHQSELPFRLQRSSGRQTQFGRLAEFFVGRQNQPATVEEMCGAIQTSRSALTNILYRTQREAFESRSVTGHHPRLRAWSLRQEVYQSVLGQTRQPEG